MQLAEVVYDNHEEYLRLNIWDPAGSRLESTNRQFFQDVTAAIVCFNLNSKKSFWNVADYVKEINSQCGPDVIKYLVGLQ